ncbi:MAG: hypothetical protein P8168_10760, partial [Deltaproteobacteria bacterium]
SQFPFFIQFKTKSINSSGVTPYVSLSTTYRWTNLNLTAGFSRDQSPSGYGVTYEMNRIYASIRYKFTERLTGSLGGSFSLSNQASQEASSEWQYFNVSPSLNYRITERFTVSTGYNFANSSSLTSTGSTAHGHIAWIQFSYSYPIHYRK